MMEEALARSVRYVAVPASMRNTRNPIPVTDAVLAEGRAHWADHCATCHANDGSGQTEIGANLYPNAPDMRGARTQNLSDGELFAIIKNGVRFTGMPAWGDPSGRDDTRRILTYDQIEVNKNSLKGVLNGIFGGKK